MRYHERKRIRHPAQREEAVPEDTVSAGVCLPPLDLRRRLTSRPPRSRSDDVNKMQDAFGAADDNYDGELDADEAAE